MYWGDNKIGHKSIFMFILFPVLLSETFKAASPQRNINTQRYDGTSEISVKYKNESLK